MAGPSPVGCAMGVANYFSHHGGLRSKVQLFLCPIVPTTTTSRLPVIMVLCKKKNPFVQISNAETVFGVLFTPMKKYLTLIVFQNNQSILNNCKRLLENVAEFSLDSFLLTGMVEQSILEQLGFQVGEATLDEKAEVLFLGQLYGSKLLTLYYCIHYIHQNLTFSLLIIFICINISLVFSVCKHSSTTVVVLGVIFGITNTFRPFSDDIFRYSKNLILRCFLSCS